MQTKLAMPVLPQADGRSARGGDHRGEELPRSALSPAAARSLRRPPLFGAGPVRGVPRTTPASARLLYGGFP
jgi:hypothetical protein